MLNFTFWSPLPSINVHLKLIFQFKKIDWLIVFYFVINAHAHRRLQCVRLSQARLITGGFASTSSKFESLMVSVGLFGFVAVLSESCSFWGVFYREKRLFIWNTEAGFCQACLTVCVQACCPVKSVFELLPVAEKCLLKSHIADVIFSHYWWRLSLMRWAGEKTGNGIGKWPETNQT